MRRGGLIVMGGGGRHAEYSPIHREATPIQKDWAGRGAQTADGVGWRGEPCVGRGPGTGPACPGARTCAPLSTPLSSFVNGGGRGGAVPGGRSAVNP